jgi:hypothetical protein
MRWILPLLLCSRIASAHSVADELSAGGTQPTAANPAAYFVSNRLTGAFTIKSLTLRPGFQYTHTFSVPAPSGANFGTSDANIYFVSLGLDAEIGQHAELGFEVNGSPPAHSVTDTKVDYTTVGKTPTQVQADAQLDTRVGSAGGLAWASYDTARDDRIRRVEGTFELGLAPTEYFLVDQITAVWGAKQGMAVPTAEVLAACTKVRCAPGLIAALQNSDDRLFQARIWAAATATICGHTDVTLDGAYYAYDRDPTQVGFLSLAERGRATATEAAIGNGLPIAPLRYTLRGGVTTRFADMSISASFSFGQYVSDADYSYDLTMGLRVQYRFGPHWKLWLRGTAQRDIDANGVASWGGVGALGLRAAF